MYVFFLCLYEHFSLNRIKIIIIIIIEKTTQSQRNALQLTKPEQMDAQLMSASGNYVLTNFTAIVSIKQTCCDTIFFIARFLFGIKSIYWQVILLLGLK